MAISNISVFCDDGKSHVELEAKLRGASQVCLLTVRPEADSVLAFRHVTSLIQRSVTY